MDHEDCGICQEPKIHSLQILRCGHVFHVSCIQNWFKADHKNSCPLCRSDNLHEPEIQSVVIVAPPERPRPPWAPYYNSSASLLNEVILYDINRQHYRYRCYMILLQAAAFLSLILMLALKEFKNATTRNCSCLSVFAFTIFNIAYYGVEVVLGCVSVEYYMSTTYHKFIVGTYIVHMITGVCSILILTGVPTHGHCDGAAPTCREILWEHNPTYVWATFIPLLVVAHDILWVCCLPFTKGAGLRLAEGMVERLRALNDERVNEYLRGV